MTPTADSGPTGPRLRARARTGSAEGLRPEVAEALGGLERSIGDITEWEQVLAGTSGQDDPKGAAPGGAPAPSPADLVLLAHVTPGAEEPDAAVDPLGLDLALPIAPRTAAAVEPELEPNLDLSPLFAVAAAEPDPLAALIDPPGSPTRYRAGPGDDRRRRNGRILSWAGAILLVAVAAVWLLPDSSKPDKTVVRDTTTTSLATTTTRLGLDGPTFPTLPTTTLPVAPVAPVTVPATTATTARRTTSRATTTTVRATPAPTTTTTAAPTTTTTVRVTTTTAPAPPTTICYPGGEPDPAHGTC